MPTINRKCNYCGKEYYVCHQCEKINSWKNVCCSRDCYLKLCVENGSFVPHKIQEKVGAGVMRAALLDGRTITITGYDLELNKFDCSDGVTRGAEDFSYFILSPKEMKSIEERLNELTEHSEKTKFVKNSKQYSSKTTK